MSSLEGEAIIVDKDALLRHERQLLKQLVLISSEDELLQGPLDQFPLKQINVPDYTGGKKKDESNLAYVMIRHDIQGEKRISEQGQLQDGRTWLFNTFRFGGDNNESNHWFVLLSDVMKSLLYEGDEESFTREYDQLSPLEANEQQRAFLKEKKLLAQDITPHQPVRFYTTRSVFVQFGAAVILGGLRVFDDYWESLAREKNLTPHHRVFKLDQKLLNILQKLKPSLFLRLNSNNETEGDDLDSSPWNGELFETPYPTITEQASAEIRDEYGRQFAEGQHAGVVVPGQSINGSLELSNQFKLPKYHSKNSFQQAAQLNALDLAIGGSPETSLNHAGSHRPSVSHVEVSASSGPSTSNKSGGKRLLSNIMDTNISSAKSKKSEEHELISAGNGLIPTNVHLNVNGWKFETLPLRIFGNEPEFSVRGLPYYEKDKILDRLKKLSPNQIKELEHLHDSVALNKGLQSVRKIRSKKWTKYWQYKSGLPVGILKHDVEKSRDRYLRDVLNQKTSTTIYNDATLIDEVQTTSRAPNANFFNNSNIKGFKPPYAPPIRKEHKN
ncbi:hypothetical protein ZYGR_0AS00940 [Zygosaccharomyces rouxii]|uniref:Uncharacterized protein n=1 Tax=Zygosaccharomyces rouxii TaxID=4956 RepID=A0A1Q3AGH3_ZYGRO|nr:hypothetical protein ZYGR_0AS00940 [Zygosaccharomyces rouxii]